jgi:hypothetical protein
MFAFQIKIVKFSTKVILHFIDKTSFRRMSVWHNMQPTKTGKCKFNV